ncbi:hypothetical protein ACEPAI_9739 [Sanghuangporus weigelae]
MSTPCSWNSHQETILLNVLKKAREAGLQSESGWKNTAFEQVVEALSGTESESGGSRKNVSQVKSRWQKFKSEYTIVKKLRNASGFGWDSERGLVTASADVWDAYIAVHDKAKKFKKTPFPFYDDIAELVDGIIADGRGAFRPGRANQDVHVKAGTSTFISVDTDTTVSTSSAQAHVEVSESASNTSDSDVEDNEKAVKIPDKQPPDTSKTPATLATKKGRQSGAAAIFALSESIETVANSFNATARYQPPIIGSDISRLPPNAAAPIRPCMEGRHVVHRRAKPPTRAAKPNSAGARVIADTRYFM